MLSSYETIYERKDTKNLMVRGQAKVLIHRLLLESRAIVPNFFMEAKGPDGMVLLLEGKYAIWCTRREGHQ